MVTLDFSKCKTKEDVEKVWNNNKIIIPKSKEDHINR